jgi:hypothetical protein
MVAMFSSEFESCTKEVCNGPTALSVAGTPLVAVGRWPIGNKRQDDTGQPGRLFRLPRQRVRETLMPSLIGHPQYGRSA